MIEIQQILIAYIFGVLNVFIPVIVYALLEKKKGIKI